MFPSLYGGHGIFPPLMRKGHKGHIHRSQPNLSSIIIELYKNHPELKLKEIAEITGASYDYVRKVISRWRRREVTARGGPSSPCLPVHVHGFWYVARLPREDYERCPLGVSRNRNRQKVYRGRFVRVVLFPSGNMVVYPLFPGLPDWRVELRRWLESWLPSGYVDLVLESLESRGEYHVSAWIPPNYLPRELKFRIKGIGRFQVDKTPFRDTLEFQADPEFLSLGRRLHDVENAVKYLAAMLQKLSDKQLENAAAVREFAKQIETHLTVMRELKTAVSELRQTITDLRAEIARLSRSGR